MLKAIVQTVITGVSEIGMKEHWETEGKIGKVGHLLFVLTPSSTHKWTFSPLLQKILLSAFLPAGMCAGQKRKAVLLILCHVYSSLYGLQATYSYTFSFCIDILIRNAN